LENSRREITVALLTRYPQLLRKYMSDKAKISPLVDIMVLLKLEMYSLKRQEKVSGYILCLQLLLNYK
jgi:cohesin complex subunit SA-1/2